MSDGSVTFNFIRQQADQIVVPTDTVELRFEFFTGPDGMGSLVKRETRPYASSVTFENVPTSVNSTVVTAITAEGFPLTAFAADIVVKAGEDVAVGATDGVTTQITADALKTNPGSVSLAEGNSFQLEVSVVFSNGDQVALSGDLSQYVTIASDDAAIVTAQPDGTLLAGISGNTQVIVTFLLPNGPSVAVPVSVGDGSTAPSVLSNLTISVNPTSLPVGTMSDPIEVFATIGTGAPEQVTSADDVVFLSNNPSVTVNAQDRVVVANDATPGLTVSITAHYLGQSVSATITVDDRVPQSFIVEPTSVNLPYGGFEQPLTVTAVYSDGDTVAVSAPTFTKVPNTDRFDVTADGVVVSKLTLDSPGSSNLKVEGTVAGVSLSETISVSIGDLSVTTLSVSPGSVTLIPGQVQEFEVLANLSDGTTQIDVSDFEALVLTTTNTEIAVSGKQVVAASATSGTPAKATFSMAGASQDVIVTVNPEKLSDIKVFFAGNELIGPKYSTNLPRGYVGVVEVVGIFGEGANSYERPLFPGEYKLWYGEDAQQNADLVDRATTWVPGELDTNTAGDVNRAIALRLFDENYEHASVRARFNDGLPAPGSTQPETEPGNPFSAVDAITDELYGFARSVTPSLSVYEGSDVLTVRTRDTYRAIAADWRRGEEIDGDYVASDDQVNDHSLTQPYTDPGADLVAPGAQRFFVIDIDENLIEDDDPEFLNVRHLSVTVVDPKNVTFVSAEFPHYKTSDYVFRETAREMDVRVNFTSIGIGEGDNDVDMDPLGFHTGDLMDFRLAEANVDFTHNGFQQVGTALGYSAIKAPTTVGDAIVSVAAFPLGGHAAIPVNTAAPEYDPGSGGDASYTPGKYLVAYRTFGPVFGWELDERSTHYPFYDLGPITKAEGQSEEDRNNTAPPDQYKVVTYETRGGNGVSVVQLQLLSVDPIDKGNALEIPIGKSQIFRTIARFQGSNQQQMSMDVSEEYPPTLFTAADPADRSFVSTRMASGLLKVSAVADRPAVVDATDIDEQVGNDLLSGHSDVDDALATNVRGIVVALDATLTPIEKVGEFIGELKDLLGNIGKAQSVTTVQPKP